MTDLITIQSRRKDRTQDVVTLTAPEGMTDADLARAAGLSSRHWGYNVHRTDDGSVIVALHTD